jgi:hypothetical protein
MSKKEVERILREFEKTGKDLYADRSTLWLANNLSKIQTEMKSSHFNRQNPSQTTNNKIQLGQMLFFGYDPKTKDKLNFWDIFPLIFLIHKRSDSFLGLNLHYLSPMIRAKFLNNLLRYVDDPKYIENPTTINMTYKMLKGTQNLKPFKAAIKKYYISSIVTKINIIPSSEWKFTTFMPLDKFQGASRGIVWSSSDKYLK